MQGIKAGLAGVLAVSVLIPATAAASFERTRIFDVIISGVQTTEWTVDHQDPHGLCSRGAKGKGSERVTFTSVTPTRVALKSVVPGVLFVYPAIVDPAALGRLPVLSTQARIVRNGHLYTWENSVSNCRGTGGDGPAPPPPPAKDCGSRRVSWDLVLNESLRSPGLRVYNGGTNVSPKPYKNCPGGNYGWPIMQQATSTARTSSDACPRTPCSAGRARSRPSATEPSTSARTARLTTTRLSGS